MGLWPLNVAVLMQGSSPAKATVPSLQNMSLTSFIKSLKTESFAAQIEALPISIMIDALEELCEHPELYTEMSKILLKSSNVIRVLQYNDRYHWKIVMCFQCMETQKEKFVKQLVTSFCHDEHVEFESMFKFGCFLAETGWHVEAVIVLEVALERAEDQQLEAIGQLLISQVFTKNLNAEKTCDIILTKIAEPQLPRSLQVSLNIAISIYYFETYEFQLSHQYAVEAFRLLNQRSSPKQVIQIYSDLARTCIPLKLPQHAQLLITQAVTLSYHHYGSASIVYAKTLEEYALYLVTMNALEDGMNVFSEAQRLLLNLYGPRNLQQTVTQGNLCFGVYLQATIYRDLTMAKRYLRNIGSLMEELNAGDRRLLVAIGRATALIEADIVRFGRERDPEQLDRFVEVQPLLKVEEVQRLFPTNTSLSLA